MSYGTLTAKIRKLTSSTMICSVNGILFVHVYDAFVCLVVGCSVRRKKNRFEIEIIREICITILESDIIC